MGDSDALGNAPSGDATGPGAMVELAACGAAVVPALTHAAIASSARTVMKAGGGRAGFGHSVRDRISDPF
jgi:hypothetical protein